MPRPISDEELQLKKRARRRLVGAIVLVTAVAVILPMVLDSEPRPVSQNVEIQIPSTDSGELKPKSATAPAAAPLVLPATPGKSAPAAQVAAGTPIKGMPPVAAAPKAEAPSEHAESKAAAHEKDAKPRDETKTAAKEAPKAAAKDAADANGAYVVQVAALADASRVKQLQKQMTAVGVKAYTEAVTTKSGEVTRVRAGPYATREAAESARSQLKKAGLDGKVVPK